MRLNVGERLEGAGPTHQPGGYVVTSVVRETPWFGLYVGKKIFYNFDFTAKRVRETDDVEWLDVFLRTLRYPILDDPGYVQQRRALARAEVRAMLGNRHSNLWPEPLDLLEVENTRDPFAFADTATRTGEPVIVFTRPHGCFTPEWQQRILPITSILAVLAELLEFLTQAHEEGLLLLGLGPASLLIDASDRVHYIGTEMVLPQQSGFLKVGGAPEIWQRMFPADRFARGYSAPECFDPARRPDTRSDLYAWGTLAYSLIMGTELGAIAQAQGRPWITLDEAAWSQFEKVLAQLPANSLQGWAEQIGVEPKALLESWPRKFLSVFRMLLSAEPGRRPRSVRELRAWLTDPPPSPVAGFLALSSSADAVKLLLDCTGVEMDLEMAVQCTRTEPAMKPADGTTVVDGPLRPVVNIPGPPASGEPVFYTAFTRRKQDARSIYSPGVWAPLWHVDAANLRRWTEQEAGVSVEEQVPARVGMVLGALDVPMVVESLRASTSPRVRGWALRRVEQSLRLQGHSGALENLLERFLTDPQADLRQMAAHSLWTFHPGKTDDVLLKIVDALESPPLDASIPLGQFLRQLELPDDRIRRITLEMETRRPSECPLCHKPITMGERGTHLQSVHGYLLYEGDVFPAEVVRARLWERVLHQADRHAHEELIALYQKTAAERNFQESVFDLYLNDLQHFLPGGARPDDDARGIPLALSYTSVLAYQNLLRQHPLFVAIARQLLHSPQERLRELAGQTVLPYLQEQLHERPNVTELRRLLTLLCPELEQTDLQIELCRQLSQLDTDQNLVRACITELQEERLVRCTECGSEVQAKNLEFHLRRAHQIFEFRGQRGTYQETRAAMARTVCTAPPDVKAWHSLHSLAQDKDPRDADRHMVAWLYQHIKEAESDKRVGAIRALADVVVTAEAAQPLLPILTGPGKNPAWELLGQGLALEICARLRPPLPPDVFPLVKPFLDHKELSRRGRENAALALLRSLDKSGPAAGAVVRAYVAKTGKKRALEKLHQLEQRFGQSPAIDALTRELEDELRMSCPRCPTELRKKDMVVHLWNEHRLVLDGQRVREPWRVIEDWLVDYGLEKDARVLERCRELALKDDPHTGLARLQRLLYRRGLRDRELLNELRAQVRARNATLCPHCCALVPLEKPAIVPPIAVEENSLEGYGYRLEVKESGLLPTLRIETPDMIIHRGHEPGRGFTRLGSILVVSGPLIAGAYSALDWYTYREFPPLVIAAAALGLGLFTAGLMYVVWPTPRPARERLVKAAWKLLVPEMLEEEMNSAAWGFLHGLAELSGDMPPVALNRDLVRECCEQASQAAADPVARACLARLNRLYLAASRARRLDPFDLVLSCATACFKGKLPLSLLADLLEPFHGNERSAWDMSDLNRLPILLADRAFSADVDVDDWLNLGRAFPALSGVLNLEQRRHWLQFHALWQKRDERPWDKIGTAMTMLELARAPEEYDELLAYYPDVLLYAEAPNVILSSRGVWIEGSCVTSLPAGAEISAQRVSGGYELHVGYQRITCSEDPRPYLEEVRNWARYYFQEFMPGVQDAPRPMTESRHRMWQLGKVTCPECERPLVPCPSDLGVIVRRTGEVLQVSP